MAVFGFRRRARAVLLPVVRSARSTDPAAGLDTGPGWYDSSNDLRCGLLVREGPPADGQVCESLEHHPRDAPAPPPEGCLRTQGAVP